MYLFIIGTRPEAIKLAPLILKFKKNNMPHKVLLTGQHTTLVDEVLTVFEITADYRLEIMKSAQTPSYIISEIMRLLDLLFHLQTFTHVLVHGDTSSALAGALCAFQNKIKVIHIEAGLRSNNLFSPFPEESNRRMISSIASISFVPTQRNYDNLTLENNQSDKYIVGNTIIDAFQYVALKYKLPNKKFTKPFIILTTHRRENIENLPAIFQVVDRISKKFNLPVMFPMHPNPSIKQAFNDAKLENTQIHILPPQSYAEFSNLMIQCKFIISDSAGVQEEAFYLNKPIIVLRKEIERQEALISENTFLVGTDADEIETTATKLIEQLGADKNWKPNQALYGKGDSADKICAILLNQHI